MCAFPRISQNLFGSSLRVLASKLVEKRFWEILGNADIPGHPHRTPATTILAVNGLTAGIVVAGGLRGWRNVWVSKNFSKPFLHYFARYRSQNAPKRFWEIIGNAHKTSVMIIMLQVSNSILFTCPVYRTVAVNGLIRRVTIQKLKLTVKIE